MAKTGTASLTIAEPDIEPALDEQLLVLAEAGELAQLGDRQRCSPRLGHEMTPQNDRATLTEVG